MSDATKKFDEAMAALKADFAAHLPEKINQIETTWAALQGKKGESALEDLHRAVHSLSGSGATFGFPELSQVAQVLEVNLKGVVKCNTPIDEAKRMEIAQQITAIKQTFSQFVTPPDGGDLVAKISAITKSIGTQNAFDIANGIKKIFLVEDEPKQSQELALQLSYFGYDVRVFNQLEEFFSAIKLNPDVLVLMDISFPGDNLGGVHAMKQVQESRETPVPLLYLTALDGMDARLAAVRTGGLSYLSKPVNIGNLVDKLDELTSTVPLEAYRVLIMDDSVAQSQYYAAVLGKEGMVVRVENNPMAVIAPLREFSPDLILMDVYMPDCNGMELACVIRQLDAFVSIPIVYLSTEVNMDKQLSAMSLGGDDFLTKPIKPEHLISAVTSRIQRSRLLRSFMVRDSLTGLLNHTSIKDQLVREVARAKRQNTPLSYAMIDIDHFKQVNDTYGHPAGDGVIKSLSRLLKQRLRETDVVGRYGGEEFAVIMSNTDSTKALRVLDEVREAFSCLLHLADGKEFSATFSCGVADMMLCEHCGEAIKLGDLADKAMYEAKHAGRNQVVLAKP